MTRPGPSAANAFEDARGSRPGAPVRRAEPRPDRRADPHAPAATVTAAPRAIAAAPHPPAPAPGGAAPAPAPGAAAPAPAPGAAAVRAASARGCARDPARPAAFGGASHLGLVRAHNEDAWCFDAVLGLAVLADGMGGYNAGEVASGIAVEQVRATVERLLTAGETPRRALSEAVACANAAIRQTAARRPECAGMGTTLVAIVAGAARVDFVSVGDSRLYRWRNDALAQLTRDDTVLREMRDAGAIGDHPRAARAWQGVLTRAVGVDAVLQVEPGGDRLEEGDLLLLCSDGLTDMLDDEAIAALLRRCADLAPSAIADALVCAAVEAGGVDNVSVVVTVAGAQGDA